MNESVVYAKHETVSLKTHRGVNEVWLHDRTVADPSMLGLGDVRKDNDLS